MRKDWDIKVLNDPDDLIILTNEAYNRLRQMWAVGRPSEYEPFEWVFASSVPHDLLISNTIPLPDFKLELQFRDEEGTTIIRCIVNTGNDGVVVGFEEHGTAMRPVLNEEDHPWELFTTAENYGDVFKHLHIVILNAWYSIQLCLLNPQLQPIFKRPTVQKEYTREGTGKNRKRVTRYIRKHYITAEDIDEALHVKGNYSRKTMAWYVIGHWREYKNGRRKFIKGHWKGPLREAKKSLDGGRIRELEGISCQSLKCL